MSDFKTRIKELRLKHSLNYSQLASILGKSEGAIRAWESGRTNPDIDTLVTLSRHFEVSSDYLVGLSDLSTPENVSIGQATGLTNLAIERLKQIGNMGFSGYLSELISSARFMEALSQINSFFELRLESEYNTIIRSEDLSALQGNEKVYGATVHRSMFENMYKSIAKERLALAVDDSFPKIKEAMETINGTIEELTKDIEDKDIKAATKAALRYKALRTQDLTKLKEWFERKTKNALNAEALRTHDLDQP